MSDYQLIVIGAGPGGYMAALQGAKLGLSTAVVESRECGGTCLNRGCVPTKTLLHTSGIYREALGAAQAGIHFEGARIDVPGIFANKRRISETLSAGIETLFKKAKVTLLRGTATIPAAHEVQVTDSGGNGSLYTADHIIVATGSEPARPPIPGLALPGVLTSDELLEGTDHLYRSIVIIGGGVIGVELATFYSDLGSDVTIIEGLDRLLPNMDRELGQNLSLLLKKQGVSIHTGSMVQKLEKTGDDLTVFFQTAKGEEKTAAGEVVLCAIGRRPKHAGLFTGDVQPEMDRNRIVVNDRYETSIPGVYAVGDVSARIQLAHVATAQGIACVDMICGQKDPVNQSIVPSCIYCRPEIASVGLSEAEAKEQGYAVKVGKCVLFGNARTLISDPGRSFIKVVADDATHEVLGAQLMCEHATDMISQFSEAIANHMTPEQLLLSMRPHPTYEEAVGEALEDLLNKFTH